MSPVVFFNKKERGKFEIGIPVESPQFHWIKNRVADPIRQLELELEFGHSKNQFWRVGVVTWNFELTPILFQTLVWAPTWYFWPITLKTLYGYLVDFVWIRQLKKGFVKWGFIQKHEEGRSDFACIFCRPNLAIWTIWWQCRDKIQLLKTL